MEEPVVSFIVNQLGNLLVEESKFLLGVNDQVIELKVELNRLMAFLERVSGIKDGDPMLTNWEDEVRELAYDSQDIIEMSVLQVSSRRKKGGFRGILKRFACILNEAYLVHNVGSQISTIKGRISSFNRTLEVHGIKRIEGHAGESSSSNGWRKTRHHVEEDPVGLEADLEIVVQKLVDDEDCRIISIFGLGGLGKTTLARSVFHHKAVESHFNGNIAWACISQQYNPRDILQGILVKLLAPQREEIEKMRNDELLEHLCRVQKEKKCLVVLDDIWSLDAWSEFKDAFPIHGQTTTGSRILITTRDQALGRQIHPSCFRHQPSYLDKEESWELLKRKALGGANDLKISVEMEAEGRKMAEECKGLPLAIIVLGGLLADKGTFPGWQEVYKKIKSQRRGKDHEQEDQVSKVLALSYHDLPYKYKPCFLFLSSFPEDYMIHAKTLYRLWIAEDIVSTDDKLENEIMMAVAERYLDELVRRCIVQVAEVSFSGKIKYCRIHDVMRDFCLAKARRHNFLTVVHPQDAIDQVGCSSIPSTKIRRLAVQLNRRHEGEVELPQSDKFHYLRSILLFNPRDYDFRTELDWNFKKFKLLKTLRLDNYSFLCQKSVESIGKLARLRYLSLADCGFVKWTTFFYRLKNLQTLDLGKGYGPIGFDNMGQLRHLSIRNSKNYKIKLLGLTNLETLEGFNTKNFDVKDLFELKNLRRLVKAKIDLRKEDQGLDKLAAFVEYLNSSESPHLRKTSVELFVVDNCGEEWLGLLGQLFGCVRMSNLTLSSGGLSRLPEFSCSTSGLTDLILMETRFEEDPMPTLERLPKLQRLSIHGYSFAGKRRMTCSAGGFPQLETLELSDLWGLKDWRVDEGAMPNLSTLEINNCQDLEMFPDGLRSITTLEKLWIWGMAETFIRGAEDFHRVPVIQIFDDRLRTTRGDKKLYPRMEISRPR